MRSLSSLKGLGPKRLKALQEAGINSVVDLLGVLPKDYLNASMPIPIAQLHQVPACVAGKIKKEPTSHYFGGRNYVRAVLYDSSGEIPLIWFNQPWVKNQLSMNQEILLFGKASLYQNRQSMVNPKLISDTGILPVYPPLAQLPGKVFSSLIAQVVESLHDDDLEPFPDDFLHQYHLCKKEDAWRMAHFPKSLQDIEKAKRRLAFENLLVFQHAIKNAGNKGEAGLLVKTLKRDQAGFWAALPFEPTKAQKNTLNQIAKDLGSGRAMRRLVQGDVGSGKTAVAFGAVALTKQAGFQSALMAPTELLARQHYASAQKLLAPLGISCGLLLGSQKAAERKDALKSIETGEWHLVIGTQAILGAKVQFHNLGLVITDEQHRFGVRQRGRLAGKAASDIAPHVLALSATPIPRSLALTLYGDLDVSIINEVPPGRTPVKTRIVPEKKRNQMYEYLKEKASLGEQSYLVCPLVEDSETEERKSATSMYEELKKGPLRGIALGLTYGNQEEERKQAELSAFYEGKTKVLVSTTVIEVGMDVPNATTMVVEDADRFGLAQLHQLRGRVGRGSKESWCFLLGQENERLLALTQTNDGFLIAQKDLEQRGPGEFLGTRQHGRMLSAYGTGDLRLIEETRACLLDLEKDPKGEEVLSILSNLSKEQFKEGLDPVALD